MSIENESKRVKALREYEVMDTPVEVELDEITKLALIICETPISYLSLIDDTRVWFKSKQGVEITEIPIEFAFCKFTMKEKDLLVIEDLSLDERTKFSPVVMGDPFYRFYAGMPLNTPCGYNIGTLCVLGEKPKCLNENQKFLLRVMAKQAMTNFELKKNNKELLKLSKAKEEFFSNMSHELRTPLNAISGFTDILSKTKLDDAQKEQLGIIKSSVDILISLINDILDSSKIGSGHLKIDNHPFNLRTLIKTTYELLKVKAQEKKLPFILNMDKNIPSYINGDKVRLNQILVNLIGNAIKFTSKGSVTLNIKTIENTQEETELNFSVKDSGIGIPPENLKDIFQRFHQVEGTTRVFGGSGLGLNISNSLVELQSGKLEVKSELGKGSEFCFTLKYRKSSQKEIDNLMKEEKSNEFLSKPDFKNIRILLAEDNIINVKLVKKVLEGTGIHLDTSENGKVCIEKLKLKKYDLILMDMCMPEMDGCDATQYIRHTMKLDIPIVGLSANVCEVDRRKCLDSGMNDYISKPFKIEELFKAIDRFCKIGKDAQDFKSTNKAHLSKFSLNIDNMKSFFNKPFISSNQVKRGTVKIKFKSEFKEKIQIKKFIHSKQKSYLSFKESLTDISSKMTSIFKPSFSKLTVNKNSNTINLNSLKEYSGNDEEFERELIDLFLKEVPIYLKELDADIFKENYEAIKNTAHKLKSPMGIFGLNLIKSKFEKIEELSVKSQIVPIIKLCMNSKNDIEEIFVEMKKLQHTLYCQISSLEK